ncbi:MAG TPA: tetratricopeptide repeat protein [Longimicrobium sp.]|nr:tetratricopeptide repeat protein [Longimicrobium sp.]
MADLSPELAAKIQSLEGGYADNPGRYFVALAGAWREAGEIGRAEEILRENLKRFPGLSAHVLLGRCLADRGAHQEAANEFHYVLSIDAQNLIALRTLAEMAAATGRRGEAERWYNELLSVDPMNAEARAALAQLSRGGADASVLDQPVQVGTRWGGASEPAPVAGGADAGGADADEEFGMIDLSAPDASAADASGVAADDDAEGEWGDLPLEVPSGPEPAAAAAPAGDFDALDFGSVDLDATRDVNAAAPWLDADARQDLGESAAADQTATAWDGDDTLLAAPLAGADLPFLDADATVPGDLPLLDTDAPAGLDFTAVSADAPGGLPPFHHGDDHADHHDHDVDGEVVTETMAELYAAQGLLQQSADTYRELIRQRGEEPGLVRRLAEIEARLQTGTVEAPAPAEEEAPDWLASVDAFAMGGAAGAMAAIHMSAEPQPEPEPVAAPADSFSEPPVAAEVPWETAEPFAATFDDTVAPVGAGAGAVTGDVDAFADSFAGGFDGVDAGTPEPAFGAAPAASADAGPSGDRERWEAPAVRETEPVGFDLIVVEEDGDTVAAPPEVVADVSADWAIAAAPLEDDEEEAEVSTFAAPVAAGVSTMRAYFTGLLAWQPGQAAAAPAAVETPAPEPAVERSSSEEIAGDVPATPAVAAAEEEPWAEPPAPPVAEADDEPWNEVPPPPVAEADDEPWNEAPAAPVDEAPAYDLPAARAAEPADEPWAAPAAASAGDDDLPLMDLNDEPWAAPRTPEPASIDSFTLADDAATAPAAEAMPWELPSEPAQPAAEVAPVADVGGGFSFEDFFAGSGPSAGAETPIALEPEPEPEPVPEPEAPSAFVPSLAFEPAPPPSPVASAAPATPAASAPAAGQDEDDEDLESFQAWLQSLKR